MSDVTDWLVKYCSAILVYLDGKDLDFSLDPTFWIVLMLLNKIAKQCTVTFKALQLPTLLLSVQKDLLCSLIQHILEMFESDREELYRHRYAQDVRMDAVGDLIGHVNTTKVQAYLEEMG